MLTLPASMISNQFRSIFYDFEIQAVNTVALFDKEYVEIVVNNLNQYPIKNLVIDPVMVAKGGAKLLSDDAIIHSHGYLKKTIKNPLLIGHGHGPLNHGNWEDHNEI